MASFARVLSLVVREALSRRRLARRPEPSAAMDETENVRSFHEQGSGDLEGRVDGVPDDLVRGAVGLERKREDSAVGRARGEQAVAISGNSLQEQRGRRIQKNRA